MWHTADESGGATLNAVLAAGLGLGVFTTHDGDGDGSSIATERRGCHSGLLHVPKDVVSEDAQDAVLLLEVVKHILSRVAVSCMPRRVDGLGGDPGVDEAQ